MLYTNPVLALDIPIRYVGRVKPPRYDRTRDIAIGARARAIREERGWSQEETAERVTPPTSQPQVDRLEKGQRKWNPNWLYKMAGALQVHQVELLENRPMAPEERGLVDAYRELSEDHREIASDFISSLRDRDQRNGD